MSKPKEPTIAGSGLGGELRTLRNEHKLSLRNVAAQLGWQPSKISRIETGNQGVKSADLASLLVIYGVTGEHRARLLRLAEHADEPGWWETYGAGLRDLSKTVIRFESEATAITNFEPTLVPGLLQTREYMSALMKSADVADTDIEIWVAARLGRQAILSKENPPQLLLIVDETALRRVIGSELIMARQLRQMVELAEYPNIELQVLPLAVGGHPGIDGAFVIHDLSYRRPLVFLEHRLATVFLEEPWQVTCFREIADKLRRLALSPTASVDLIAKVGREYEQA